MSPVSKTKIQKTKWWGEETIFKQEQISSSTKKKTSQKKKPVLLQADQSSGKEKKTEPTEANRVKQQIEYEKELPGVLTLAWGKAIRRK